MYAFIHTGSLICAGEHHTHVCIYIYIYIYIYILGCSYVQVNEMWSGLGYYRRAKMLHEGAKYVMEKCVTACYSVTSYVHACTNIP